MISSRGTFNLTTEEISCGFRPTAQRASNLGCEFIVGKTTSVSDNGELRDGEMTM